MHDDLQIPEAHHSQSPLPSVVFFDLGGVVVDVDLDLARRAWSDAMGTGTADFDRVFLESGIKDRMDVGQLGTSEALREIEALVGGSFDEAMVTRCWSSSLSPRPRVSELIHEVAARTRCAVISNTDPLHAATIEAQAGIAGVVERWVYSYQAGCLKPEPGIFELALQHLSVRAEQTLLVDDREENLAAARELGMEGLHYDSFETLRRGMAVRGLIEPGWLPR